MSDSDAFGFGKFIPGFDFLQQLAKGASDAMPQVPGLSNWIAPTLSVEELDKRISELRAVQYWLEQNGRALAATIQALEVQKMTLSTLKGMDVTMTDLAQALQAKPEQAQSGSAPSSAGASATGAGMQVVDPLQWWSALTQQFQQIAASTLQQAAQQNPVQAATQMASDMAQEAVKTASQMSKAASDAATQVTAKAARPAAKPRKTAAPRKAAAKKTSSRGAR